MNIKTPLLLALSLLVLVGCVAMKNQEAKSRPESNIPPKSQTVCPVMGGPIDKNLYVDVKGKRIYICCAACESAIKAEPDKYIKKIEARGELIEDTPKGN